MVQDPNTSRLIEMVRSEIKREIHSIRVEFDEKLKIVYNEGIKEGIKQLQNSLK